MTITVYSKLVCPQCDSTYRALFAAGLEFEGFTEPTSDKVTFSINVVDTDAEALEFIKELGYLQAPVVIVDGEHWSGFRPDKIAEIAARIDGLERIDTTVAIGKFKQLKEQLKTEAEQLIAA